MPKKTSSEDKEKNTDRLNSFMFGSDRSSSHEDSQNHNDWLLGSRKTKVEEKEESPLNDFMENIDLEQFMKTVDSLIDSAAQFKPIVSKVKPIIEQFIRNKQS